MGNNMMARVLAVFVLFGVLAASTATPELSVFTSQNSLSGWNCNPSGGPAIYSANVFITNEYKNAMAVELYYYDFQSGTMVDGGRQCLLAPESAAYCKIEFPLRLGGESSGYATVNVELVGVIDDVEETPSADMSFTVFHQMSSTESRTIDNVASAEVDLTEQAQGVKSLCNSEICCGLGLVGSNLASASERLTIAREHIRTCEFTKAIEESSLAQTYLDRARTSYNNLSTQCTFSLAAYENASTRFRSTNMTLLARSACGINTTDSQTFLSQAASQLAAARQLIATDEYTSADAKLKTASYFINSSLNSSANCGPGSLSPPVSLNSTDGSGQSIIVQTGDALSQFIGSLGYVVFAAIILVVGVAVYVAMGGRTNLGEYIPNLPTDIGKVEEEPFEDMANPSRKKPEKKPIPPSPKPEQAEPQFDHSKIDQEFEEWLKSTEAQPSSGSEHVSEQVASHKPSKKHPK